MAIAAAQPDHHMPSGIERRKAPRREITDTVTWGCTVAFNRFTAGDTHRIYRGSIRNCAEGGVRLESNNGFGKGTILLVRMLMCPFHRLAPEVAEELRTILMAEVKWVQYFEDIRGNRCSMGVHYL